MVAPLCVQVLYQFNKTVAPPHGLTEAWETRPLSHHCHKTRLSYRLTFTDTRDKQRTLQVRERLPRGAWLAETTRSAYLIPGTALQLQRSGKQRSAASLTAFHVGQFSGRPMVICLFRGDHLLLRRSTRPGQPAVTGDKHSHPAEIGCSHAEVIDELKPGHAVWIDDGKLGCVVEQITAQGALLHVTHAGPRGVRIRSDKGINLPDTVLPLPALTARGPPGPRLQRH